MKKLVLASATFAFGLVAAGPTMARNGPAAPIPVTHVQVCGTQTATKQSRPPPTATNRPVPSVPGRVG